MTSQSYVTMSTGAGAFRATGEASSEWDADADGSEEGDEEGRGGLSGSEGEELVCPVLTFTGQSLT